MEVKEKDRRFSENPLQSNVLQQNIVEREKTKPMISSTEGGLDNHSVDLDTNCARASHTRKLQVLNGTCEL